MLFITSESRCEFYLAKNTLLFHGAVFTSGLFRHGLTGKDLTRSRATHANPGQTRIGAALGQRWDFQVPNWVQKPIFLTSFFIICKFYYLD